MLPPAHEPIKLQYTPRPQFLEFHRRRKRWAVLICHRRCGKTFATLTDLIDKALRTPNGRLAFITPFRMQAKLIGWDLLKQFARPFLAIPPNEFELRVDLIGGARVTLFGGNNRIRSGASRSTAQ